MNRSFHYRLDAPSDRIVPRFYVNPEMLREVLLLPEGTMLSGCTYDYHYNRFVFFVSGDGVPNEKVVIPWYRQEDGVTKFDGWHTGSSAITLLGGK